MMSHTNCEHASTPSARSKCRRANGVGATTRNLDLTRSKKEKDEDFHPIDRHRQCVNCRLRIIMWKGRNAKTNILTYVCNKCKYTLDKTQDIMEMEV